MIAFYISSHGFGHLTRCLAIAEVILNTTNHNIYIACDNKQNEFAKIYLKNYESRVIYNRVRTDVGLYNKQGSLEIDKAY